MALNIVAVCIGPQRPLAGRFLLPNIPLYYHQSPKHYYPRGSPERIRFTADNRNQAMREMLEYYQPTDVLMIDDYYLDQKKQVQNLVDDYIALKQRVGECVLGGGTWTRDKATKNKLVFWDSLATPECSLLPFEEAKGIHRASGIGACYLFPFSAWQKGARYGQPDYGTDHLPFHQQSGLPLWIDLNVKLWHPANADVHVPFYKKVRMAIGPRRFLPYGRKDGLWWYRGWGRNRTALNGMWDYERWIRKFITFEGRQFVEVGANVGMHTVRAGPKFGTVYAFEPEREANRILRLNVNINGFKNTKVYQCAVGAENGATVLNLYQHSTWNSLVPQEQATPYGSDPLGEKRVLRGRQTVQIRKLDSFKLQPSLLMVDVEGAEEEVLYGAKQTIMKVRPEIIIEAHSESLKKGCVKILEDYDYHCHVPQTVLPEYIVARPN